MMWELLISLALWAALCAVLFYIILPGFRKNTNNDLLSYIGTVEKRLEGFLEIPDVVRANSESIRALIDMMNERMIRYEPTPGVLRTNITAIKYAELALVKSQEEIGRLFGENAYLEGYVEGIQAQTAKASNRLGQAIHDVPLEMLEKIQIVRERHSEGSSPLRKKQVRAELKEDRDNAEGKTFRDKQEESIKKGVRNEGMEEFRSELDESQKRVRKALENELKDIKKRKKQSDELDAMGLKDFPTEMKNEEDFAAFIDFYDKEPNEE